MIDYRYAAYRVLKPALTAAGYEKASTAFPFKLKADLYAKASLFEGGGPRKRWWESADRTKKYKLTLTENPFGKSEPN